MDHLDYSHDAGLIGFDSGPSRQRYSSYLSASTWPNPLAFDDQNMSQSGSSGSNTNLNTTSPHHHNQNNNTADNAVSAVSGPALPSRRAIATTTTNPPAHSHPTTTAASLPFHHAISMSMSMDPSAALLTATDWNFPSLYPQDPSLGLPYSTAYEDPIQTSPTGFMSNQPATSTSLGGIEAGNEQSFVTLSGPMDSNSLGLAYPMSDFNMLDYPMPAEPFTSTDWPSTLQSASPSDTSISFGSIESEPDWTRVEPRYSYECFETSPAQVVNPQTLHIRTDSNSSHQSDLPSSAQSIGSFEEVFLAPSPRSDHSHDIPTTQAQHHVVSHVSPHAQEAVYQHAYMPSVSPSAAVVEPVPIKQSPSTSTSPSSSSGVPSPPSRPRKSPVGVQTPKAIVKKAPAAVAKDPATGKRVGRRRGPLRPEQRQQAHEIRKMRACLRCKFLKKTCDKGDPCGGCQPSHARLWQVPCTRIDIKEIAYFMKDWKADYERHISLGFSVGNIKGFSTHERPISITHGYGHSLPIKAREVYVYDTSCFGMDWVETIHETPRPFEISTHRLSAGLEGIPQSALSEYLDKHIDGGFENFVDDYFEGTAFLTEMLKTAYRYYVRERSPVIRKALKLVVAYNLTLHVTFIEPHGLAEDERKIGHIDDTSSKFFGMTMAPVMVNFQFKCALADMWRELQKEILEELSALYSSVYSGERLKNWPTIFMLATILLAIWEEMQFDCYYRVPDQQAVQKFCNDMESTPVGVIVGLFSAISQKLPSFTEWDTARHGKVLNDNPAVCDAMTEVRGHVTNYETYLKGRSEAKFDREDFDSLTNKFLSKLVIRAN